MQGISHSNLYFLYFFFVYPFRKRLTIQEALSHPWITVRPYKKADLAFCCEPSRDNVLTLIDVLIGNLTSL